MGLTICHDTILNFSQSLLLNPGQGKHYGTAMRRTVLHWRKARYGEAPAGERNGGRRGGGTPWLLAPVTRRLTTHLWGERGFVHTRQDMKKDASGTKKSVPKRANMRQNASLANSLRRRKTINGFRRYAVPPDKLHRTLHDLVIKS